MCPPEMTLYDAEHMVVRSALTGLLPKVDPKANLAFEDRSKEVAAILVAQFERQDTVLGTIETRRKLIQNVKYIDHFGQFTRAVDAIMALRRVVPPVLGQRHYFLEAVINATLKEAVALGLSKSKDWAHIAIYCALIARGPALFHLPTNAPEDILQPLGYVPSERELTSGRVDESGEQ